MTAELAANPPEVLGHLAGIASEVIQAHGLVEPMAVAAAWAIVTRFKAEYGGQMVYVPKGHKTALADRNAAILAAWRRGERPDLIAERYGLSVATVYSIVSEMRAAAAGAM